MPKDCGCMENKKKVLKPRPGTEVSTDQKMAKKLLKATLRKKKSLFKENVGSGLTKELKKTKGEGQSAAYKKYRK